MIGIMGLGYVGLPLSREFIAGGEKVLGFDVDQTKVDSLLGGVSYITGLSDDTLSGMLEGEKFSATTDMYRLSEVSAIIICVPTPIRDKNPDMTYVKGACETISKYLQPGQLISLESTTYPGTTRDFMRPILEKSGLIAGENFYLAYSPEREDPGNKQYNTRTLPKLVAGINPKSLQEAILIYSKAIDTLIPTSTLEVAEAAKVFENVYRFVNISLVNEIRTIFDKMGIDTREVIDAASTKPFGFKAFYPGPGIGGHCIPVDPFYLSWAARQHDTESDFIQLSGLVNDAAPLFIAEKAMSIAKGKKILILGMTYKPDISDLRESPVLRLRDLLVEMGANAKCHDPLVEQYAMLNPYEAILEADLVILAVDHSCWDYDIIKKAKLILDTRGVMQGENVVNV